MTEFHEIKIINTKKKKIIDTIYIHDDFFCYLGETQPLQYELINNIPVFYSDERNLVHLNKYQERRPTKKELV
ncbi:hypothetical protein J6TS2_11890 [Heyndrickxia sporothermodurans]|nr:hypothetical protein J6TS2_11890 [Heyndrickxia sporothermodurans]